MTSPDPSDAAVTEPPEERFCDACTALYLDDLVKTGGFLRGKPVRHVEGQHLYARLSALPSTPVRPDPRCATCGFPDRGHTDSHGFTPRASTPVRPDLTALPPGPYRVEWPAEQGGMFAVWGNQGTPPDFADGWAIPLVAQGMQSPMEWLADHLNALAPTHDPTCASLWDDPTQHWDCDCRLRAEQVERPDLAATRDELVGKVNFFLDGPEWGSIRGPITRYIDESFAALSDQASERRTG